MVVSVAMLQLASTRNTQELRLICCVDFASK